MKISVLVKYLIMLCILILIIAIILSLYTYFEIGNKDISKYNFIIVPICLVIVSFFYSRNIKNNGWIRGVEVWSAYVILLLIIKYLLRIDIMMDIYKYLLYLPGCLFGGIIGVNSK